MVWLSAGSKQAASGSFPMRSRISGELAYPFQNPVVGEARFKFALRVFRHQMNLPSSCVQLHRFPEAEQAWPTQASHLSRFSMTLPIAPGCDRTPRTDLTWRFRTRESQKTAISPCD